MKENLKARATVNRTHTFEDNQLRFSRADLRALETSSNGYILRTDLANHFIRLLHADHDSGSYLIRVDGYDFSVRLQSPLELSIENLGFNLSLSIDQQEVAAPMPGQVLKSHVQEGDEVSEGSPLITLQAMKMENVVQSLTAGTVESIHVSVGDTVSKGDILISFKRTTPT